MTKAKKILFINEGTPIIVTRVNEALILVKKRSDK